MMTEKTVGDEISNKNVFGSSLMVVYVSVRGRQLKIFCFKGEMGVCPGRTTQTLFPPKDRGPGGILFKAGYCPGADNFPAKIARGYTYKGCVGPGRTTQILFPPKDRGPGGFFLRRGYCPGADNFPAKIARGYTYKGCVCPERTTQILFPPKDRGPGGIFFKAWLLSGGADTDFPAKIARGYTYKECRLSGADNSNFVPC